jgi:hypothetical protein
MALSSTPTLTEINTELGTSGQSLATCIDNAGMTGTWDRQSDFAGYSASYFTMTQSSMSFLLAGTPSQTLNIVASGAWTLTKDFWINIAEGLTGSGNASLTITCDSLGSGSREGSIDGDLDSDPTKSDSCTISQNDGS